MNRDAKEAYIIIHGDDFFYDQVRTYILNSPLRKLINFYFCSQSSWKYSHTEEYCSHIAQLKKEKFFLNMSRDENKISITKQYSYSDITRITSLRKVKSIQAHIGKLQELKIKFSELPQSTLSTKILDSTTLIKKILELEFHFYNPNRHIEDIGSATEKSRISQVSFDGYKTKLHAIDLEGCKEFNQFKQSRFSWINKLDQSILNVKEEKNEGNFFVYMAHWFHKLMINLYKEEIFYLVVAVSIRVLELFLTGHLFHLRKARIKNNGLELRIYRGEKEKWATASGFKQVWEAYKHNIGFAIPDDINKDIETLLKIRNKTKLGHGYLPASEKHAKFSIKTSNRLITLVEENIQADISVFVNTERYWRNISSSILKEVFLYKLCSFNNFKSL